MNTLMTPPLSTLVERMFADAAETQEAFRAERAKLSPAERAARTGSSEDYKTLYLTYAKNVHLAVSRETATLLYMLVRSMKARHDVPNSTT